MTAAELAAVQRAFDLSLKRAVEHLRAELRHKGTAAYGATEWQPATSYAAGSIVLHFGKRWRAKVAHHGYEPGGHRADAAWQRL